VIGHGDKKELVEEIVNLRRSVERHMTSCGFAEALVAYQDLCAKLEQHVRKPHAYFLQARAGISHCIWNLYCRQQKVIDDQDSIEDITGRDHAKNIYRSEFTEKIEEKTVLDLGEFDQQEAGCISVDEEKKQLIENIKVSLQSSSLLLSELKAEQVNAKLINDKETEKENDQHSDKDTS
ncbi:MAG: hypothetical protein ACK559_30420, partial [bacterium]